MRFEYGSFGHIAEKDLIRATKTYQIGEFSVCGFYCQQCLEKIGKQYLQRALLGSLETLDLKTHRLKKIYSKIDLADIDDALVTLYALTDCYFDSRYPGEDYFELDEQSAWKYLNATRRIFEKVCNQIEVVCGQVELTTNEFKE